MGPNVLWLAEALSEVMTLKAGMRTLDMGCGRALSSIFLAKDFGIQVWATDLWIDPAENWKRIREAGVEERVFPIRVEAHDLPFAADFFDAIVSLDAYHYFGTDVHYLEFHMLKHLKPGGQIGIVSPAWTQSPPNPPLLHITEEWYWMNTVAWWERHWRRYPELQVQHAGPLPNGWELWLRWHEMVTDHGKESPDNEEYQQLCEDQGIHFGFVRMVAARKKKKASQPAQAKRQGDSSGGHRWAMRVEAAVEGLTMTDPVCKLQQYLPSELPAMDAELAVILGKIALGIVAPVDYIQWAVQELLAGRVSMSAAVLAGPDLVRPIDTQEAERCFRLCRFFFGHYPAKIWVCPDCGSRGLAGIGTDRGRRRYLRLKAGEQRVGRTSSQGTPSEEPPT